MSSIVPSFAGMKLYMFSASLDCDCFFVPPGPGFLGGALPRLFGIFPPLAPLHQLWVLAEEDRRMVGHLLLRGIRHDDLGPIHFLPGRGLHAHSSCLLLVACIQHRLVLRTHRLRTFPLGCLSLLGPARRGRAHQSGLVAQI